MYGGWGEGKFTQCVCREGTNVGKEQGFQYCDKPPQMFSATKCHCFTEFNFPTVSTSDSFDFKKHCNREFRMIERPCKCTGMFRQGVFFFVHYQ